MSNTAFNPLRGTREPRADEHVPPSERYVEPPAALIGPPPSYSHYRTRVYSVLGGPPVSLFVRALEEDKLRAGWAKEVRAYTGMDTCDHGDHPDSCSTCARFAAMAACYREGDERVPHEQGEVIMATEAKKKIKTIHVANEKIPHVEQIGACVPGEWIENAEAENNYLPMDKFMVRRDGYFAIYRFKSA